jgi:hypothetical protein
MVLSLVDSNDTVNIQLLSGRQGSVMGYGSMPASLLLSSISAQARSRMEENVTRIVNLETTVVVRIQLTKEYMLYRKEAMQQLAITGEDRAPICSVEFGVALVESNNVDSHRDLQSSSAISDVLSGTEPVRRADGVRKNRSLNNHHVLASLRRTD